MSTGFHFEMKLFEISRNDCTDMDICIYLVYMYIVNLYMLKLTKFYSLNG